VITLIYRFVLALALFLSVGAARAQIIEDIDLRPEGTSVVLQIRFIAAIQYTRNVSSRSNDLVQAYYDVEPTKNLLSLVFGQRLVMKDRGLPDITVIDESAGRGGERSRKLVIGFARPMAHSVRAGRGGRSIEVVFPKAAHLLVASGKGAQAVVGEEASTAYAVTLISASDLNVRSVTLADLPAKYGRFSIETVRRVVDGVQKYEVRLGMFGTRQDAIKAAEALKSRFPQASVVSVALTPPIASDELTAPGAASTPVVLTQAQIEERAARYLDLGKKAESAGKLDQALALLSRVLDMPPNRSSAEAQLTIGIVRIERGEYARGRAELELFINQYPKHAKVDQARSIINESWSTEKTARRKEQAPVEGKTTGVFGVAFYGGQSRTRTQEFVDSVVGALPTPLGEPEISKNSQRMINVNLDMTWRRRDQDEDIRLVFRERFKRDCSKDPITKGTSAFCLNLNSPTNEARDSTTHARVISNVPTVTNFYLDYRSFADGTSLKLGRQSPSGLGVMTRFDGAQAGYTLFPKFRANVVAGMPSDHLMNTQRYFYGASLEAEALTQNVSASLYFNRGMIDGVIDRNAVGTEWRYFDSGLNASFMLDIDTLLKVVNIGTLQGAWQLESGTSFNFMVDRRMVSPQTLSNALYFGLNSCGQSIRELLVCRGGLDSLRHEVHEKTPLYTQVSLGFTKPLDTRWSFGANVGVMNIGSVAPVAEILPEGAPGTGDMWSGGLQMIGSNLYSGRDSHVFSVNQQVSPVVIFLGADGVTRESGGLHVVSLQYNNSTGIGERWQLDPSLRLQRQVDFAKVDAERLSPSLRVSYKVTRQFTVDSDFSYERTITHTPSTGGSTTSASDMKTYSIGARLDF
jgi:tetratricopeptide (TPR) repeat protein